MKASELRIGNFVQTDYEGTLEVININSEGFDYLDLKNPPFKAIGRHDIKSCMPIPLTEEWLLKFGFNVVRSEVWELYYIKINKYTDLVYADDFSCGVSETNTSTERGRVFPPYIKPTKYVHQLQNLYFALTGEELKIKS